MIVRIANYQKIQEGDPHQATGVLHSLTKTLVSRGRLGQPRWVIMSQDNATGAVLQGVAQDLIGVQGTFAGSPGK